MIKYHRDYVTKDEFLFRYSLFCKTLDMIKNHHNAKYTLEINKFADWTDEEFEAIIPPLPETDTEYEMKYPSSNADLPESFDWRDKGHVTPVKD